MRRCCFGAYCLADGWIREGQPTLSSGDGTLVAHSGCVERRLEMIGQVRAQGPWDPDMQRRLRQLEAAFIHFDVSGSGTLLLDLTLAVDPAMN
jgi:hypothetical protein